MSSWCPLRLRSPEKRELDELGERVSVLFSSKVMLVSAGLVLRSSHELAVFPKISKGIKEESKRLKRDFKNILKFYKKIKLIKVKK